jgi:hypothetical protein
MIFDFTMDELLDALEVYAKTDTPVGSGLAEFLNIVTEEILSKVNGRLPTLEVMKAIFANGIFVGMFVAQQRKHDPFEMDLDPQHNKYLH